MTLSSTDRTALASTVLAPHFRDAVLSAFDGDLAHAWSDLSPAEREMWAERARGAVELFKGTQVADTQDALFQYAAQVARREATRLREHGLSHGDF